MKGPAGTIYAVVRTGHHVRLLSRAMRRLQVLGYTVQFAHFRNNPGASGAVAQIEEDGFTKIIVRTMLDRLTCNDTVVFAVLGGLNTNDGLAKLVAKGVRLTQVVEGGRFHAKIKYHPTLPIPLLAWGPSAHDIATADVRVVGAPVFEHLKRAAPVSPPMALINYKFTYREAGLDADGSWLRAAISAAVSNGYAPVVSGHPKPTLPDDIELTERPVGAVLRDASLLITRASTILYDALSIGVQPFYLSAQGERLREFSSPLNAYPMCHGEAELSQTIRAWKEGRKAYDSTEFLEMHVSVDPKRSAALRMADEIALIHNGAALDL